MTRRTYRNPVLDADWPDLDAIAYEDRFYLISSSFHRAPGLPVLRSADLVSWEPVGHALSVVPPASRYETVRPGEGVWAPALRVRDDGVRIYWGDPDAGIFLVRGDSPEGPWDEPVLVVPGRGLIDPCPFLDEDGREWLVHGWAHSRAGIANRLDVIELTADGRSTIGEGRILIEGSEIAGCSVLEGPKVYSGRGFVWVFAPAGGVATGWQYVFRARSLAGPWDHRIVLAQGDTDVNGPHQGAWVTTPAGEDWFLHFQDRGWAGRVVHLQPMRWTPDDWPVMGDDGRPVAEHDIPAGLPSGAAPPLSPATPWPREGSWFRQAGAPAHAAADVLVLDSSPGPADPRIAAHVHAQRLDGRGSRSTIRMELDGDGEVSAGVALLGADAHSVTFERGADGILDLVSREWTGAGMRERARVRAVEPVVEFDLAIDRTGRCILDVRQSEVPALATTLGAGRWVGATIGFFATAGVPGGVRLQVSPV